MVRPQYEDLRNISLSAEEEEAEEEDDAAAESEPRNSFAKNASRAGI